MWASTVAQEQRPIRSISIVGNSSIAASTVEAWLETKRGKAFVPSDVQRIASRYAAQGYPLARVDSLAFLVAADSSAVDLVLWIREGKPAYVSDLQFEGMKVLQEATATAVMPTRVGERFVPGDLEQGIGALLKLYEKSGYPFAKVALDDISFTDGGDSLGTKIALVIDEGKAARISQLRVEGNTTTKTSVIVRQARLTEGELFRGDQPAKVKQRLEKLQLFSSVSLPELYVDGDGSVGLSVRVAEGNPNRFDGIIGYVPSRGKSGDGYVTGLLDVQFRNILGTARRLAARWYRENQSSQDIELRYREPWVASLPLNAEIGFAQRKQDSSYIRNAYRISADLIATDELNLGLVVSSERVLPTEGYGIRVVSQSRTMSIGFTISYDSRDDLTTPTSGFNYRTEYHTGVKEIQNGYQQPVNDRSSTQRLAFDFEYLLSPFEKQVLAANIYARDFRSGAVELSDLFRLGGTNTLRGYREGQFLGSRIAWTNLEYRLLAGQRSYVFGFVDAGYVLTPERKEVGLTREEISRVGYGVGLRLDTPLGLMGVSLAFGQGDTFGMAKLHIRLVNEF